LYIIGIGLILGNLIGLTLAFIQDRFALIPLNPASYFVDSVPILLNPLHILLLNAGTLLLTMLMMLIPAGILTRISPDKTIKFD
jgi:lipoprotein-releasing system permease protein